ncbi:MAG: hypothetical protein ACOCYC_00625 [bacterium]
MRRPFAVFYIILTVLFFLGVIGVAAYRLNDARVNAHETAVLHFRSFRRAIEQRLNESGGIDPTVAQREVAARIEGPTEVKTVVLYSLRDGVYYLWAADRNRVSLANVAGAVPVPDLESNSLVEARILDSIQVNDRSVILEAIYGTIDSEDLFLVLRDSLIAVLGFAVVTLIVSVISLVASRRQAVAGAGPTQRPPESEAAAEMIKTTSPPAREQPLHEQPIPEEPAVDAAAAAEEASLDKVASLGKEGEIESDWTRSSMSEPGPVEAPPVEAPPVEPPPVEAPPAKAPPLRSAPIESDSPGPETVQPEKPSSSLFSQVSGVGHREHLEHRLTLELERAAYNEQDLAAALAAFPGLSPDSSSYKQVAELLVERFGFRDLIFEFDSETFCLILPNADLDESIHLVEDFQRTAAGRLPQTVSEPIFGLSARTGRLVDGTRLIREARSALQRAAGASGRIIGFRPDPQKYRRHVAGNRGSEG